MHALPLELARGECFRVRTQGDLWRRAGLQIQSPLHSLIEGATAQFLRAACARDGAEQQGESAARAIHELFYAGELLADCYNRQAIEFRKQNERQLATLLGASIPPRSMQSILSSRDAANLYRQSFNTIGIPLGWNEVQNPQGRVQFDLFDAMVDWGLAEGMRLIAGPLFNFQKAFVPEWIYLYEEDFQSLVSSVESFVERAVNRYAGKIHLWHAIAGLNTIGPIKLDEEQVMRLAVAVIHTIRRNDPRTPVLISIDQPWGEYLGGQKDGISPLHFADALIRSNLGISGIGLELRMNYEGGGSLPRGLLEFSQQIDRWGTLGLPLLVQFSLPAAVGPDPGAIWKCPVIPLAGPPSSMAQAQAQQAIRWIEMMLAKGVVHGVLWEGWDDRDPHGLPHSGLIDGAGMPRPLLGELARLRSNLLS